jgi:hypothetical protein
MVDRFGKKRKLAGAIPDWNQTPFIKKGDRAFPEPDPI